MSSSHATPPEEAARKLLATYGARVIWDMHLAAAAAHGMGEPDLAASLINLAEAAEERLLHSSLPTRQPT